MERYEAYKDSGVEWIGEIPEHWSCANLGAITKLRKCLNRDGSINKVLSLSYGSIKERIIDNTGLLPESFTTYNVIQPGDVVLRLTDLQNDQRSLRVGICRERGIITAAYTTVIPETIDAGYLFYSLADFDYWKGFYGLAGGVRQSLTFDGIRNLKFPLPSMFEQRAIADYLDAKTAEVDALVADCEREVELLREYRKAVISEAVTKGLDPDAPMKDSGIDWIGEIPEEWELWRLKHLLHGYKAGPFGSSLITSALLNEGSCLVYSPEHVASSNFVSEKNLYLPEERIEEMSQFTIEPGDIVFPIVGSLGRAMMVNEGMPHGILNQRLAKFRIDNSRITPAFFMWLYGHSEFYAPYIIVEQRGSIIVNLTKSIVGNMPVPVPPISEQQAIADYLDVKTAVIDSLIEAKQSMADKLREYRKSLISEAVTGKFKVPGLDAIS